ncbi:hypothetical protein DFH06DRAFT_1301687 [Mycena polygramma]|nr:hypothetical protein DFH06DRAFT_1301687 [Mycena polygramma]
MSDHVDGLWFPNDPVVVLRAGEKVFRVPKSILAARSSVFQAMFEFPQPAAADGDMSDVDEVMDGSPVIRLHDSPKEVEAFLRAIFDSSYFMPPPAEIDFYEVLGILRLSHKYDVGYLHKRALCHLERIYLIEIEKTNEIEPNNLNYDYEDYDFDLAAIPVLHDVGANWLLPYAYYNLAIFSAGVLFGAGEIWARFPSEMQRTCILAQALQSEGTRRIFSAFTELSTCASSDTCNVAKFKALRRCCVTTDPATLDKVVYDIPPLRAALCAVCAPQAEARYKDARAGFWNDLPANCGMKPWDVLLEKRRVALE